jgi:hypothetical protein
MYEGSASKSMGSLKMDTIKAHVHSTVLLLVHFRVWMGVLKKKGSPYVYSDMNVAVISLKHEAQLSCLPFKNSVPALQKAYCVPITKMNRLMQFTVIITVYSENQTKWRVLKC